MGAPRDAFDPLMYLGTTNTDRAGPYAKAGSTPSDSKRPSVIQRAGDGTEEIRSAANTKHNSEVPRGGGERSVYPSKVDRFDPINLTRGPMHPDVEAEEKNANGAGG